MDRKPGHLPKSPKDVLDALIWVKVVGLGNAGVGKTSLIKHFCESQFSPVYQPTIGVDYGFKIEKILGEDLRIHLWDLSGNSDYLEVRNELYGNTQACFLVYDISSQSSFDTLDTWLRELGKYGGLNSEVVVVANKTDLKTKRVISMADGRKWASAHKLKYYETSAVTGEGVQQMFQDLLMSVREREAQKDKRPKSRPSGADRQAPVKS
ncbi:dnaJ homolog subfamily C member 27-like [Branchiostoma floridae]|uniref:DnaJ homolog subfamily C member 27-like n=1 Tax=Branchiostoma floridae TaxID=7739 RepID=A0A9J7HLM0_BRAFL|nr:dnaJ homolog subfamily C member 27-like [Branchiostoma floridae]